jgi:hypothetical protein
MGFIMSEWDISIGSLLDLFNLRFAPPQGPNPGGPLEGGITEMVALQREFGVFKEGRPFAESARLLGLGGLSNNLAKNRWFTLLETLARSESDVAGVNGDQRIVRALIDNLTSEKPLPCYLKAHDSREKGMRRVIILPNDKPLGYMTQEFLTISLPMEPRRATRPSRRKSA